MRKDSGTKLDIYAADEAFRRLSEEAGYALERLPVVTGTELMFRFYAEQRFVIRPGTLRYVQNGCCISRLYPDQLIVRWRMNDPEGSPFQMDEHFTVEFIRWFTVGNEDETHRLYLRFDFHPNARLRKIEDRSHLCEDFRRARSFQGSVLGAPVWPAVAEAEPRAVSLDFEHHHRGKSSREGRRASPRR